MKSRQSKKPRTSTIAEEKWIDVDDLVKPGQIKEIWPGLWVNNTMYALESPEPVRRTRKPKSPRKK